MSNLVPAVRAGDEPSRVNGAHAALPALVPMDRLGGRLKELRQSAGLSLRELARQADVSPSLVSQIENGKSRPSVSTLYSFARLLERARRRALRRRDHGRAAPAGRGDGIRRDTDPANAWHPSEYANRISVVHPPTAPTSAWPRGRLGAAGHDAGARHQLHEDHLRAGRRLHGERLGEVHEGFEYGYVSPASSRSPSATRRSSSKQGESLGFDSTIPHVFRNIGDIDFQGLWFVHGSRH